MKVGIITIAIVSLALSGARANDILEIKEVSGENTDILLVFLNGVPQSGLVTGDPDHWTFELPPGYSFDPDISNRFCLQFCEVAEPECLSPERIGEPTINRIDFIENQDGTVTSFLWNSETGTTSCSGDNPNIFTDAGMGPSGAFNLRLADCVGTADLAITKTDSPDPVIVGNDLTYTVTVTNNGPDVAGAVIVTDDLPAETTFVSCSPPLGAFCSGSGNNQTVTIRELIPGESKTITFVAAVNCSVADGTVISNTATYSPCTPDPDATNNSATATTTVSNPPPTITGATADPSVLWPPNHRMVNVTVSYDVMDNCPLSPNSCTLSVTSNEPINGDWIVLDAHHVQLRAEREGNGNGRIYTITVTCIDGGGNSSSQQVEVTVPHDRGRR